MRKVKYPFSPELLDALPEELAELFRALEDTLLDEVCSRLKIADQLNEVTVQDIRARGRTALISRRSKGPSRRQRTSAKKN